MQSFNWREPITVDLTQFQMDDHVKDSFVIARSLAGNGSVNAGHLLQAAVYAGQSDLGLESPAYRTLKSLLPLTMPEKSIFVFKGGAESVLLSYQFDPALAGAYAVARVFWKSEKVVRGRDYITMALLAVEDPSLSETALEAGADLDQIQGEWFRFVNSDNSYRSRAEWKEWWEQAGVSRPDSSAQPTEIVEGPNRQPTTYLLTWDPADIPFSNLAKYVHELEEKGQTHWAWNVGHPENAIGARVFLMRHGDDMQGLVGSGKVVSEARTDPPWRTSESGPTTFFANILWDVMQEFPIIGLDELLKETDRDGLWTASGSGHLISPKITEWLEKAWEKALATHEPGPIPKSIPPEPSPWIDSDSIPVFGSRDFQGPQDSLNVKQQAEIFASLLIARDVKPPFALGLLGDWGVGKTFFMRLMQANIQATAGRNAMVNRESGSVSRAAQIEFNAWHYVDSDLWASLASSIFDQLSAEFHEKEDKVAEARRRLRSSIHSSGQEKRAAEAAIKTAQETRQSAANNLAERQMARAQDATKYEGLRLKRVWQAVLNVKPDPENKEQESWPDIPKFKEEAEETAKALGITKAINDAEEAQRVYGEFQNLVQRGFGLSAACASLSCKSPLLLIGLLFCLGLVLGCGTWILEKFCSWLTLTRYNVSGWLAPLLQVTTLVGAAAAWVGKQIRSANSAASYLEKIVDEIRNPRVELIPPGEEEKKLQKNIESIDGAIASEHSKIEEADRQIAAATAEIARIDAGGLVYDFLEGRIRDSHYLDRLGLISVIRRDFEELGSLLRKWPSGNGEQASDGTVSADSSKQSGNGVRPIERIILYIDDLDRCPPHRVVDVLQAVHLLLAFDLFVVVVAVDPRWLERSLNEAYNPFVAGKNGFQCSGTAHPFSAHNYLEKIFQIPFHLPEMHEEGYRKLVQAIMASPNTPIEAAEGADPGGDTTKGTVTTESLESESEEETRGDGGSSTRQLDDLEEQEWRRAESLQRKQEDANKLIQAMLLDECEEKFIACLFLFISTPRLAKRFVNVYRLLRVSVAKIQGDAFSTFIDRDNGDYRAMLTLLAISVGFAEVAPEIVEDLRSAEGARGSFSLWLEEKYSKKDENQSASQGDPKETSNTGYNATAYSNLRTAFPEIKKAVDSLKDDLSRQNGPAFDDGLKNYRKWAPHVGRFSFRRSRGGMGQA